MAGRRIFWVLALALSGCGPLWNTARTTIIEPTEYCATLDAAKDRKRAERFAEEAWCKIGPQCANMPFLADYASGYRDGYTEYLFDGWKGDPVLPPRAYFRAKYRTPEGHQAVDAWYAGYRHGVNDAVESGYREFLTVPTPVPGPAPAGRLPNPIISGPPLDFSRPSGSLPVAQRVEIIHQASELPTGEPAQ